MSDVLSELKSKTKELQKLRDKFKIIGGIKGLGLMIGVELETEDASGIVDECMKEALLINLTQKNILRIMPPITVSKENIDMAIEKLAKALERL